ncbi:MarR family transcriptional regulator [Dermatophilaceae bacterium Sec6.4]
MPSNFGRAATGSPLASATAAEVITQAQDLVLLWDRAEDWATPRIPPLQVRVLTVLDRQGSMNLTQLSRAVGAIPSSASRLCDRLEAAGLLERQVSADSRREVTLRLSVVGRHRLEAFAETRRRDFAQVLDRMSPQSRDALVAGLRGFGEASAEVAQGQSQGA